jgi:hypothetical protein
MHSSSSWKNQAHARWQQQTVAKAIELEAQHEFELSQPP